MIWLNSLIKVVLYDRWLAFSSLDEGIISHNWFAESVLSIFVLSSLQELEVVKVLSVICFSECSIDLVWLCNYAPPPPSHKNEWKIWKVLLLAFI